MMLDSTVVCRRALGCEWGGKARNVRGSQVVGLKGPENLGLDMFWVVDHHSDLKK